jgi:hypothetical protein
MKNIQYIISVLIFTSIFFVGQYLIELSLDGILENSSFRYSQLYTRKLENDVISVGNSRGVNSIYTPYFKEKYNINIMNLSYNGLKSNVLIPLLEDYLDLHKKPKTILIEVSNLYGENYKDGSKPNKLAHFFSIYTKYSERLSALFERDHKKSSEINKYFGLYRYNSELLGRNIYYIFKKDSEWINRYRINRKMIENTKKMYAFTVNIDTLAAKSLARFASDAREKDIKIVLYIAPYLPDYRSKISNIEIIKTDLEKLLGHPIIDLSKIITSEKMFADRVHSNELGAWVTADTLVNILRN